MSLAKKLFAVKMDDLKKVALGNSTRTLKHVACDYLHEDIGQDKKRRQDVANNCFLNIHTVERVMDCEENYRPMSDTLERILRYYGVTLTATESTIKSEFQNKPKIDKADQMHDDYEM